MSDQEKQVYMNKLFYRMHEYLRDNKLNSAEACLNNYEAKLNLGWPHAE